MNKIILFLSVLAASAISCNNSDDVKQKSVPFILVGQGNLLGAGKEDIIKQNIIITDSVQWQDILNQMNVVNDVSKSFAETNIDFSKYQVIAIFDEVKGNGGWSIDITKIEEQANEIIVYITNLKTGDISSVITQPYQIVKIPVSEEQIIFKNIN